MAGTCRAEITQLRERRYATGSLAPSDESVIRDSLRIWQMLRVVVGVSGDNNGIVMLKDCDYQLQWLQNELDSL